MIAAAVYGFFLMACAFNLLWRYASHNHRLISREMTTEGIREINRQYLAGPVFYGLAFILAFGNVTASLLLTLMLAVFYAITSSTSRK